ncbi:hypothetical protein SAMN05421810_103603 [Amycolatopsis arida]|uniref:Uncharacterized protein n=1 Tax=Amycolatopsis arida TaxID=587909 RepID=A0A1I5TRL2_9PSEU|nr:hypothetical protein [Amycolatopsis arida]TDX96019.1 hypothetical protein CLV69_103154 [Amycolatopsis arida]SFP84976.1 hypothetical protein SAMN05421810_103603 [Amycolatopsis arida]
MTGASARIRVFAGRDVEELASPRPAAPGPSGGARVESRTPRPGELDMLADTLVVAPGAGGPAAVHAGGLSV